ncbi:hypothetical protein R6Z07F_001710 [Ovis aries]
MKEATSLNEPVFTENRDLFSVAYKNIKELETVCNAMLALLDKFLMRNRSDFQGESKVFSLEMKGDSYRCLAGAGSGEKKKDVVPNSALCGKEASATIQERLQPTHAIRLGQASLYAEIQKDRRQASLLAFHGALTQLDSLNDYSYKDYLLVVRLLRENLTLWRGNQQDEEAGENNAGASVLPHHNH